MKLGLAKSILIPGIMVNHCTTVNFGHDRQTEQHDAIAAVDVWSKLGQHDWMKVFSRLQGNDVHLAEYYKKSTCSLESAAALACVSRYLEYVFWLGVRGKGTHMLLTKLHAEGIDPEMWVPAPLNYENYIVIAVQVMWRIGATHG